MKIGFVGLGMLGLPMALVAASGGHQVRGYDNDPERMAFGWYPGLERGRDGESLAALAARADFAFAPLDEVLAASEIIFLTVPTPNLGSYDGTGPFPAGGAEYDLRPLRQALAAFVDAARRAPPMRRVLAVVSTVLPGTLRQLARELPIPAELSLAHTPAFSAVGTYVRDILNPEFVLVGAFDADGGERLEAFFRTLTNAPIFVTGPENAELIKTSYNGFIGLKIGFANALMELAHKTPGCDVDAVVDCLSLATQRLISPRYLRGGLGDGGGCHPKENAALAALAQRLELSFDPFGSNMVCRDRQSEWLASLVEDQCRANRLPLWLLGTAFKPNVSIETGSPALLLLAALLRRGLQPRIHDPLVPGRFNPPGAEPAIFVLAMPHDLFNDFTAAPGSIIIDPWRRAVPAAGVRVVAVGRGPELS